MNARGLLAAGYVRREDGTFAKRVEFLTWPCDNNWREPEVLIRSSTGKLLRVERSGRALARRGR